MIYFCVLIAYLFKNVLELDAFVSLYGDEWEYQSLAVNFALGNDLMLLGKKFSLQSYAFDLLNADVNSLNIFTQNKVQYYAYREPVFVLVLGSFYKLFGISPFLFKILQLIMLVVASNMFFIYGIIKKNNNMIISGMIGAIIHIYIYGESVRYIMPEVWMSLLLAAYFFYCYYFTFHLNKVNTLIWIVFSGILVLTKAVFLLIPLFFVIYLFFNSKVSFGKLSFIYTLSWILPIGYSLIISTHFEHFIFITSQGLDVLLASNNEFSGDGRWHPEWKLVSDSYYNLLGREPQAIDVLRFYQDHIDLFLSSMKSKIYYGCILVISMVLFFSVMILEMMKRKLSHPLYVSLLAYSVILILYQFSISYNYVYFQNIHEIYFLIGFALILCLFLIWYYKSRKDYFQYMLGTFVLMYITINQVFYVNERFLAPFHVIIMPMVIYSWVRLINVLPQELNFRIFKRRVR